MKLRLVLGLAAVVAGAVAVASAATDGTASIKFSTKASHAPTALTVNGTFAPGADGQQRILNVITLVLPTGTKLNGKAVALCPGDGGTAADDPGGAEHACPPGSKVGSGTAHVLLGDADTTFDITAWNQATGPMLQLSVNGTPAYTTDAEIKGNRIVYALPLADQIQAKTKSFMVMFDKVGTKAKPYLRTPSSCPKGRWKGGLEANISGGGTISLPASTACKKTH